jgi:predicted O-methyltransferase YrrM
MTDLDPIAVEACKTAIQRPIELSWLLSFLREKPPSSVLEIGCDAGGSLWAFAQVATDDARLMGIDAGIEGSAFPSMMERWPWPARDGQRLSLYHGESTSEGAIFAAKSYFARGLDFLFIDADHSYEAVRADWETYSPLVKNGGLVGFHDVNNPTVGQFFAELQAADYRWDRVTDPEDTVVGIGVIWV